MRPIRSVTVISLLVSPGACAHAPDAAPVAPDFTPIAGDFLDGQ